MDDTYVEAILEEFVRLYDAGMIYRGARVINWCPRCATAISDIEVEYVERDSHLWHIRYPFADGSGFVTVATTRPETMLGDTAVAVNPEDDRYKSLVGKTIILPLMGREIPLIADSYASSEFGTGAVKVTPAHDLNDYEAGRRHNLPMVVVIGEDAQMTEAAGPKYAGLTREQCRDAVVADLQAGEFLVGIEDYHHSVATCDRCKTIIEPLLSEQWFVKMAGTKMVEKAMDVVRADEIEFVPDRYKRIYLDWLENIKDWCISRQLWWGHRIPIYYAPDGRFAAGRTREEAAKRLGVEDASTLAQDEDVLDTWFSSALWPFATMGWPERTQDLANFYPTDVLTTAREIIYLWVARMVMTSEEFLNQIPFKQVYIYATVLDKDGKRMSKSKGNGIDPVEMIDKYGTDALRFSLVRLASKGQDIRFSEERIPESRNFCNKIWNAARFVLMNIENAGDSFRTADPNWEYSLPERWILSRLHETIATVDEKIASYDLDEACAALYEFFWNDYCDWFVELSKPALRSEDPETARRGRHVLWSVLETTLRLMHPIMPFVTEEIWQALPHDGDTIMHAPYPVVHDSLRDKTAESHMEILIGTVRAVRNARAELGVAPSQNLTSLAVASPEARALLEANETILASQARVQSLTFVPEAPPASGTVALPVAEGLDLYLMLADLIDFDKERARLDQEIASIDKDLVKVNAKLGNPGFISKAAPAIVEKERTLERELSAKRETLVSRRAGLETAGA
jgi:valyl-tRNA synthetase